MSNWTEGYVAELGYVYGYYAELDPLRLRLHFLSAGLVAPTTVTACELGFGQGLSANLHAAASTTKWFGTDFNPAQAGFAQELAEVSGSGARFFDQSFAEFCSRTDLPDFDFIGMQGVWSWISDKNRSVIVDFIRRKLKVGGVVYVGYNTPPGLAALVPIQDLLGKHVDVMSAPVHGLVHRIDAALDFADRLLTASPLYTQAHPQLAARLKEIKSENRNYLAHEYFNRDWYPMSFARMSEWLAPAKLDYACSADYFNMVDAYNLTPEQQALLNEVPDARLRETARDIMTVQKFRKDYWVKGARKLTLPETIGALRNQRVILIRPRSDVSFNAMGALGELELPESICGPILDALADHRPHTIEQLEQAVGNKGIVIAHVVDVVMSLVETGGLSPVQDDAVIGAVRGQTDKLNAFLCEIPRARTGNCHQASPVTGNGWIRISAVVQLFLQAIRRGKQRPAEMAAFAAPILQSQGMAISREGKPLGPIENLAALTEQATLFSERQLPVLKALQII